MEERILTQLAGLKAGSTMCPGDLARRLGTTLAALRPAYADLAVRGKIRVTQRGRPADLRTLRGPFRVAPVRVEDDAPVVW